MHDRLRRLSVACASSAPGLRRLAGGFATQCVGFAAPCEQCHELDRRQFDDSRLEIIGLGASIQSND